MVKVTVLVPFTHAKHVETLAPSQVAGFIARVTELGYRVIA